MQPEYGYTVAAERELNDVLLGKQPNSSVPWPGTLVVHFPPIGSIGVLWKRRSRRDIIQPLALISREEDFRRLFGRFAQLRSDLSPLTSWCHLLSFKQFESFGSLRRESDLAGLEAAWAGLAIAEAQLLSERSLRELRITACLATETFATARTRALWGDVDDNQISTRFEDANRFLRAKNGSPPWEKKTVKIRSGLRPIWAALAAVLRGGTRVHDRELSPLVESLMTLDSARRENDPAEAEKFVQPLLALVPEAQGLVSLPKLAPEQRLKIFDQLITHQRSTTDDPHLRHHALALVAGYITTVAAGGTPTLALAENIASSWPEVTGWAYVIGGIGERVTWTSGFDGLGRLVSRELIRSFQLEDPPTCDFALDEASVLVDQMLPDPLVHLRMKQSRLGIISIFPGVNISIPISEAAKQEPKPRTAEAPRQFESVRGSRDIGPMLADLVWPHLRSRVEQCIRLAQDEDLYKPTYERPRNKPKTSSQMALKRSKS